MKNNGFVTIGILALLPLLLVALAFAANAFLIFRADAKLRHQCRVELLRKQDEVARILFALTSLNPAASRLRAERSLAEAEVKALSLTPLRAAAEAHLQSVIARQTLLSLRQKSLILRARFVSRTAGARTSANFGSTLLRLRSEHSGDDRNFEIRLDSRGGTFPLVATPEESPTPDYSPTEDFSSRQEITAKATFSLAPLVPKVLRPLVEMEGLRLAAKCGATLHKTAKSNGDDQWQPRLSPDKS